MNTIHKSTTEQTTEIYSLEPNKQNLSHKSFLPTYVDAKKMYLWFGVAILRTPNDMILPISHSNNLFAHVAN